MATMATAGGGIPAVRLRSGDARPMPLVGMGTAGASAASAEEFKGAVLAAVELGYRHFDTAGKYRSEPLLGEALAEASRRGLVASREELFVTSKIWCTQCHPDLVLPAVMASLKNLQMEYLDLCLIHLPMSLKPGPPAVPVKKEDVVPFDFRGVWGAMEECQRLGLAKAIGVSNFTTKHLEHLLAVAQIPPAVNQVEMNPVWQQQKLREYCAEKGIHVTAYSPLGGQGPPGSSQDGNPVMDCEVLREIAQARGKTLAQVSLRWAYEQGVSLLVKSFKKERLQENLGIFDWELTGEDRLKVGRIPQQKRYSIEAILAPGGAFVNSVDLADVEVVEM